MEEVIDRLIEIVQADLPGLLTKINAQKSAGDITKFGLALTLSSPEEYLYGPSFNINDYPSIQVYDRSETDDPSGVASAKENHEVVFELYVQADDTELYTRKLDRYKQALKQVMKNNRFIPCDPSKHYGNSQMALDGQIKTVKKFLVPFPEMMVGMIEVVVEYKILAYTLDQLEGIY